jgi:predicted nuclease of predicted toxin-antitoxin system
VRLLLDENLSESVLPALADLYPDSLHVRLLGAGGASDERVWRLAKEHGCVLVTRDEDFLRLSIVRGAPPKVVWLALGNCSNQEVIHLMKTHRQAIEEFATHEQATFLTLHS